MKESFIYLASVRTFTLKQSRLVFNKKRGHTILAGKREISILTYFVAPAVPPEMFLYRLPAALNLHRAQLPFLLLSLQQGGVDT
jgi:hypothetical protein